MRPSGPAAGPPPSPHRPDARRAGDEHAPGRPSRPLDHLAEEVIRDRLARARFARLAFVDGEQPLIFPVNVAVDKDDHIVFRTAGGTALAGLDGRRVAVEVDAHDPGLRTGWSILVCGVARDISAAPDPEAARLRALPVDCWAPGPRDRTFAVLPLSITGRVIQVADSGDWFAGVPAS